MESLKAQVEVVKKQKTTFKLDKGADGTVMGRGQSLSLKE